MMYTIQKLAGNKAARRKHAHTIFVIKFLS